MNLSRKLDDMFWNKINGGHLKQKGADRISRLQLASATKAARKAGASTSPSPSQWSTKAYEAASAEMRLDEHASRAALNLHQRTGGKSVMSKRESVMRKQRAKLRS